MAEPINLRPDGGNVVILDPPDGQAYDRIPYMEKTNGMYASMQPQQADAETAILIKNFAINENGKLQIRRPLNEVYFDDGDPAFAHLGMIGILDNSNTGLLLLFRMGGILWSNDGGENWTAATTPGFGAGPAELASHAIWSSDILIWGRTDEAQLQQFVISTKTSTQIGAVPVEMDIFTIFAGRVLGFERDTANLYWSVKNDHTDWSGSGSGNEPLRNSPGVIVDTGMGLFPVDDTHCLAVRAGSVWLITTTEQVDVPFKFDFLYRVSIANRKALSYSPVGVYALGLDDVYLLNVSGPKRIGAPIIGGWINNDYIIHNLYQAISAYDALRDIYLIQIPFTSVENAQLYVRYTDGNTTETRRITDSGEDRIADYPLTDPTLVLCYHAKHDKWTFYEYNLNINYISTVNFRTPAIKGLLVTTSDFQAFTDYRVDAVLPNDGDEEHNYDNDLVPVEAQILTGALRPGEKSRDLKIAKIEVDLMSGSITATARRTYIRLYQAKSGPRSVPASAIEYCDKSSTDSDGRNLTVARNVRTTKKFWQADIRLSKCITYTLEGIYVYVARGSEINP